MTKHSQTTDLSLLASAVQKCERRYQRTPTWVLAIVMGAAFAAFVAFAVHQQGKLDNYQGCVEAHGFDGTACRN
jgi:hypothetical protein